MKTMNSLNSALNALYSSEKTTGYVADRFIAAQQAIREAIAFLLVADIQAHFEYKGIEKNEMIIHFDVSTQEYWVGSFWMLKAFIETGNPRNLACLCNSRTLAEGFLEEFKADQSAFEHVLETMESLHP